MKHIATSTSLALMGLALTAVPASAQSQQQVPANLEKADRNARAAIRGIYGAAGQAACGGARICRKPAAAVGEAVYSTAQRASQRGSQKLQDIGRSIRGRGRN
jgi:hypothetical protein